MIGSVISDIEIHLRNSETLDDADITNIKVKVCWISAGKYALYILSCDAVDGLSDAVSDISIKFSDFINSDAGIAAERKFKEMSELLWVPFSDVRASKVNPFLDTVLRVQAIRTLLNSIKIKKDRNGIEMEAVHPEVNIEEF